MSTPSRSPTWCTPGEAVRVVLHPPYLRRTLLVTVVVGTLLFVINQLNVVLRGDATAMVWLKAAATYLVPFGVANYGVLVSTRRDR